MQRLVLVLALAPALVVGSGSCVKHPAVSAAIAGGVIGFGGCEIDSVKVGTCGIIGASTAVALGGIAWLVTTLFDTEDHAITFSDDDELTPQGGVKVHTQTAPPPLPIDAGVPDAAPPIGDAPAPVADAPHD
ncbi:MAG: hypothetical protein ACM31C_34975 [Acidobacteriota bacterium]